jgi:small subunit ribosomal protein S16
VIENLGWYNPVAKPGAQYQFNVERVKYWLSKGAQPSETAANLLKKVGVDPTPGKK